MTRVRTRHVARHFQTLGVLALAGAAMAACGSGTPGHAAASSVPSTSTTTTTTKPNSATVPNDTLTLYFTRGASLGVSQRVVQTAADPRYTALEALLAGPSASESAAGLTTDIPKGTTLRGFSASGGVGTINLSPQFVANGPTPALQARLAQLVYTATDFPNVSKVIVEVGRVRLVNFGGVDLSAPVGRSQVTAAVPDVLLESPAVGDSVHGVLQISGLTTVNGTYAVQLYGSDGKLLASATSTSAAGGSFSQSIPLAVATSGVGTVRLFARPVLSSQPIQVVSFTVPVSP
jgi:hypothetical protein